MTTAMPHRVPQVIEAIAALATFFATFLASEHLVSLLVGVVTYFIARILGHLYMGKIKKLIDKIQRWKKQY